MILCCSGRLVLFGCALFLGLQRGSSAKLSKKSAFANGGVDLNAVEWSNSSRRVKVKSTISEQECVNIGCQSACDKRVCTTPGCVVADFFQYACGKWVDEHPIPDDNTQSGTFDDLNERLARSLKRLLESPKPSPVLTLNKAKNVYKACMDKKEIDKRGVQPALDLLKSTNTWPVIQPELFNHNTYDLLQAIVNIAKMENSALIAVGIGSDLKNPTQRIINMNQAALGMPSRDYLLRSANDTTVQAYYQYMLSVAAILDARKPITSDQTSRGSVASDLSASRARIESQLPAVLDFEIALANITTPKELQRDPVRAYNKMTIAELQQRVPEFDWLQFVNAWLIDSGIQVSSSEYIIVAELDYLVKLFALLNKTQLITVANYLGWRTISGFVFDLDDSLQEAHLRYTTALSGESKHPPRWKRCVERATGALPLGVGRLYIENEFDQKSQELSSSLVANVRAAFDELLNEADWLGDVELKLSHDKQMAMLSQIGYDDRLLNDTWLNERHALNVGNATDHFGNEVLNDLANVVNDQRRLRKPVDRTEWDLQPAAVNAFYHPTTNSIKILSGILKVPLFDRAQPMSLNFGAIGLVVGHELTHGFDDQGRQFDKNGLLGNWWKQETVDNFLKRAKCVVDLYSNVTVKAVGLNLNGNFTLGENLADMGGVNAAYCAHRNWLKEAGEDEPALPGLPQLSNQQLFFLGAASAWCGSQRPEKLKQGILTDPHSPWQYRLNVPLANMPEFSRAFNCPSGSGMNPAKKCRVW